MKKQKKVLALVLCAVMLVASSVLATMAYLTSTTEVVNNTFTVGNVVITLDEAKVDINGEEVAGAARVTENTYKLMPGHEYKKDPTVHVAAGSEDSWLFVKVTDEIATIQDADTVATQMAANGWTAIGEGVYKYKEIVNAGDNIVVFEDFKVQGDVNNATLATYAGKTIKVQAYAVQADGFDTAEKAWEAAAATWTI